MQENKKGITLVELLIALGFVSLVVVLAFSLLRFTRKAYTVGSDEFELQSNMRITVEKVNDMVRYSTAVFTIPKSSFREDNLTEGWDYFGVMNKDGETFIVNYKYNRSTKTHDTIMILPPKEGFIYNTTFDKINPHDVDNLLKFTIEALSSDQLDEHGNPVKKHVIVSELEGLNALQLIDNGTAINPAVAIAYRGDDRDNSVVGHVAMVLDTSGSMAKKLNGYTGTPTRISILQDEAKNLVNAFAQENNIDISLVPFATSANSPLPFRNARLETSQLLNDIDGFTAVGGTNTGDGLRRAYHNLKDHNATVPYNVDASNYVIVLVDGVTTFASVTSDSNRNFVTDDSDVNEGYLDRNPYDPDGQIAGNGSSLDTQYGEPYVNTIGAMIQNGDFAKVYVIGFSAVPSELASRDDIAYACGATSDQIYTAATSDDLSLVFDTIRQEIVNDLWYLQGPDL